MSRRSVAAAVVSLFWALMAAGCSPVVDDATPTTRPATKTTCDEAVLVSGLTPLDRVLVPYTDDLLGVETLWGSDDATVRVVSGGYLDDLFEPYDDLEEIGTAEVRGVEAVVLASSLLGVPVRAAVWREPGTPPCDTHAVVSLGLDTGEFMQQVSMIR